MVGISPTGQHYCNRHIGVKTRKNFAGLGLGVDKAVLLFFFERVRPEGIDADRLKSLFDLFQCVLLFWPANL